MRAVAIVAVALIGCRDRVPSVSPKIEAWARRMLAMPPDLACDGDAHGHSCRIRASLMPTDVRELGATITLQLDRERYLDFDWGGGHVEAYGLLIGREDWIHLANPERGERKLRAGVFEYDTRN